VGKFTQWMFIHSFVSCYCSELTVTPTISLPCKFGVQPKGQHNYFIAGYMCREYARHGFVNPIPELISNSNFGIAYLIKNGIGIDKFGIGICYKIIKSTN